MSSIQSIYGYPSVSMPGVQTKSTPWLNRSQEVLWTDTFQRALNKPSFNLNVFEKSFLRVRHWQAAEGLRATCEASQENIVDRLAMYRAISLALPYGARNTFQKLLERGILSQNNADDKHSTLYHLYTILTVPRNTGLDNRTVLAETIRILADPYAITQKFAPLSEEAAQAILAQRSNKAINMIGEPKPMKPLTREQIDNARSSECVPSSIMFYNAAKQPSELARHISELTSPMNAFYEKATFSEISPNDPSQALSVLKQNDIPFVQTGPNEVSIKVQLPEAGKLRMMNDSHYHVNGARTGVETAYQSALAYLPTRSADPANGLRADTGAVYRAIEQATSLSENKKQELATILEAHKSPAITYPQLLTKLGEWSVSPNERQAIMDSLSAQNDGQTAEEKTLMETIVKDNGGVESVVYQITGNKENAKPEEADLPYLYGYTRSYQQTTQDLLRALQMGEFVTIGITYPDETGAIRGGHEMTISKAFMDANGELQLEIADSDDDIPTKVIKPAKSIIPQLHHMGLPVALAEQINNEIKAQKSYLKPDQNDVMQGYEVPHILNAPLPVESVPNSTPPSQPAPIPANLFPTVNNPNTFYPPVLQPPAYPQANLFPNMIQAPMQNPVYTNPVYSPIGFQPLGAYPIPANNQYYQMAA